MAPPGRRGGAGVGVGLFLPGGAGGLATGGSGGREAGGPHSAVARGWWASPRERRSRCRRGAGLAARPSHACSAAASQVGPPSAPPPESGPGTAGARTGALEF